MSVSYHSLIENQNWRAVMQTASEAVYFTVIGRQISYFSAPQLDCMSDK